jgi:hypothetical protein
MEYISFYGIFLANFHITFVRYLFSFHIISIKLPCSVLKVSS